MSERLPRTARSVDAIKSSGDLVEINLRLFATAGEDALKIDLVAAVLWQFLCAADGELDEFARRAVGLQVQLVERSLALAPRLYQRAIRQQTQMRLDARLAEPGDFLQFVHGQLVALQQRDNAQPCGVGQGPQ